MPKITTNEPWSLKNKRQAKGNIEQHGKSSKSNAGGGDNPSRSRVNRNKSGDHMSVDIGPDRLKRSEKETPDVAFAPFRGTTGSHKEPHIKRIKPKVPNFSKLPAGK